MVAWKSEVVKPTVSSIWRHEKVICESDLANFLNSPKFVLTVKDKTSVKSEKAINS